MIKPKPKINIEITNKKIKPYNIIGDSYFFTNRDEAFSYGIKKLKIPSPVIKKQQIYGLEIFVLIKPNKEKI